MRYGSSESSLNHNEMSTGMYCFKKVTSLKRHLCKWKPIIANRKKPWIAIPEGDPSCNHPSLPMLLKRQIPYSIDVLVRTSYTSHFPSEWI